MESLDYPRLEEIYTESEYGNPRDLPTEKLLAILNGKEASYFDHRDVKEILLHRKMEGDPLIIEETSLIPLMFFGFLLSLLLIFAFFGWKLYQSLKDREKKREEKKKLKQKKKK